MAEDVALPGGTKVPREWLVVGGAVGVGIVGYAWWKRRGAKQNGPTVLTVDPNDAFGATDRVPTGSSDSSGPNDGGDDPIDTDGEWTKAGVEWMTRQGWEPAVIQVALGRYLDHQKLSAGPPNQGDIVRAVKGAYGPPPSGDIPIQMELPGTNPPAGGGGGTLAAVTGLKITGTTKDSVSLEWNPVPGADRYFVGAEGVTDKMDAIFDYTTGTTYTSTERPSGTPITFFVHAEKGDDNGPESRITATTKS